MRKDKRPTLLAVLAHPDDESFGLGGTLALYAERGVAVHLICATRGEAGDMDPVFLNGFESIADKREDELRCAAGALGLAGVHFLGYRDSGMPGTADNFHPECLAACSVNEVSEQITHYIRLLKPEVVITFDPIGGYRHPDHIAVHKATVQAFDDAANPSLHVNDLPPHQAQKLYFQTISRKNLRLALRLMPLFGKDPTRWGRNHDVNLVDLAKAEFPIHAVIDYTPVRKRKEQASLCHASQGGSSMIRGFMGWMVRLARNRETFMRAFPPAKPGLCERDLFDGVSETPIEVKTVN